MLESCCNEKMVLGWSFKVRFQILREFICTLTLLSISVSLSHSLKLHLSADGVEVFLNPDKVLHQVDEKFLSICINPRIVTKFDGVFNPRNERIQRLTAALGPAYFRLGGTSADFLIFADSQENVDIKKNNFTLTGKAFDLLSNYVRKSGMELLFDFNLLLRNGSQWDTRNAEKILQYSIDRGYSEFMHFELGNEPDYFHHILPEFNLSASQIGHDMLKLHKLIRHQFQPHFDKSVLVGPDVTSPAKQSMAFLAEYLEVAGKVLDRVTFHQYYLNLESAHLADFTDPNVMNKLPGKVNLAKKTLASAGFGNLSLWLGESGTCLGTTEGINYCQRFVSGFLWMDKLGMAASMGVEAVIRQSLYEGVDALLDEQLDPLPGYWLNVLYKKLIGASVLETSWISSNQSVRFYAHCTNTKLSPYPPGAVTYFGMNLATEAISLIFIPDHMALSKHIYWLTPGDDLGLISQTVALNSKLLVLRQNGTLPDLMPEIVGPDVHVEIPPQSFGFVVIPDAKSSACIEI